MLENTEDFLAHYGVKGMKWGVRKDRRNTQKAKREKSEKRLRNEELAKGLAIGGTVLAVALGYDYVKRKLSRPNTGFDIPMPSSSNFRMGEEFVAQQKARNEAFARNIDELIRRRMDDV